MPEESRRSEKNEKQEKTGYEKRVQDLKCYHGVMNKEEVRLMMKNYKVGAFLVRSCFVKNKVALGLILSVKVVETDSDSGIHHYIINLKDTHFVLMQELRDPEGKTSTLESEPFETVEALIAYYMHHRLACKVRLFIPVARPKWQLRHSAIKYTEEGKLGSGNFCVVYRGKIAYGRKSRDVAIKVSKEGDMKPETLLETKNLMFAEAKIMMNYHHVNVIRLFGLACERPPFMVCMEFCAGGSLEDALKKHGENMEDFERQTLLIDAARGMRYLHTQKCIHRDLASRNCLISADGLVKIADFGLSRTLQAGQDKFKESLKEAPLAWLAPECIQRVSEFSSKTDVWAFGVVIFEVYNNGAKLFAGEEDTAIIRKIKRANMPTIEGRTSLPKMRELLDLIWVRKPDDRPDFQKILELLVESLVLPINKESIAKMQINKIKGVTRTQPPNTNIEMDLVASEKDDRDSYSEKLKKTRMDKVKKDGRDSSLRKARKGKRTKDREEHLQSSRKAVARTVRETTLRSE